MKLDRKRFFDLARADPFAGRIGGSQVSGIEHILDEAPDDMPLEHLSYCLATAFWETARTMQPIEEYGRGAGHPYGQPDPVTGKAYYGRGLVQLTWKANYDKAGKKLMADLVGNPALALNADLAVRILFAGMAEGWFTGKTLSDYFRLGHTDPVGARRIINGTDKAEQIAGYFRAFLAALKAAADIGSPHVVVTPAPPMPAPLAPPIPVVPVGTRPAAPKPATLPAPAAPTGFWARVGRLIAGA